MSITKWVVSGIIVVTLVFGAVQGIWLNRGLGLLQEAIEKQTVGDGIFPILDLGKDVSTFPYTNDRGITAISVYRSLGAPLSRIYILRPDEGYPRLLYDLLTINGNYKSVDPPLVTREDTVLAFTSDESDPAHKLAKILRITLDGAVTEVHSFDSGNMSPGGYGWGTDAGNGYLWKGFRTSTGIRIVKSTDDGLTWTVKYAQAYNPAPFVKNIAAYNDEVFAALDSVHKIIYSTDGGDNWSDALDAAPYINGVSIFGESVYAAVPGEEIWIAPEYTSPTKWLRVWFPRQITLGDFNTMTRIQMLGQYLVTSSSHIQVNSTTYYATADNFYTISPLIRFGEPTKGSMRSFSGFGDVMYIGGAYYGDGMVWKYKIPSVLPKGTPGLRFILEKDSLAGSAISPLTDSFAFDSRLAPTFTLTVRLTYSAGATAGAKVHVISSSNGYTFDDVDAFPEETHPFAQGTTKQKTYTYTSKGVIKVQIENLDPVNAITDIQVIATLGS